MAKPPVCMASHAAASIGKIDPLQVGGQAIKSVYRLWPAILVVDLPLI